MSSFISDIGELKTFLIEEAKFGNFNASQQIFVIDALSELISLQPEKKRGTPLDLSLELNNIILKELISIKIMIIQCHLDALPGYVITIDSKQTILSTILFDDIAISEFTSIANTCGAQTALLSNLNTINLLIGILIPEK